MHLDQVTQHLLPMESVVESSINDCFSPARKKRSDSRRRPHPDPKPVSHCRNAFTFQGLPMDYKRHHDADFTPEHPGNERKVKKLKLKLRGVTHTLHTKSSTCDAGSAHQNQPQGSSMGFNYKNTLAQKSKISVNKHAFDDVFDEDDDEEIRYLKKLRASKVASSNGDRQAENGQKHKGTARLIVKHSNMGDLRKDFTKKSGLNEDNDYEMEMALGDELRYIRDTEDFVDLPVVSGREMIMTTRKRAFECPNSGGLVEFPNGLPDAPSKKQKLSEVQNQLRKAEIAQRRKLQADRAAKEAEAEAIRKILGQDSSRKKKEDQLKKQQELAQEKNNMATMLRPKTIRLSMGPNGTVITFSEDLGLPKIFNSLPCRYPPLREKCAGPNCTNGYKYRDSTSRLPLCSLDCYKAVQGNAGLQPAC